MPLSDICQVSITTVANGVTQQGFGTALILAHDAWASSERTRTYTSLAGVASDFAVTSPTYLAATALFSQDQKPPQIMVGRSAYKPTMVKVVSVYVVGANIYAIRVRTPVGGSRTVTYVADGSDTNDTIATALETALNGLASINFAATLTGSVGAKVITLTGSAAGNWFGLEVMNTTLLEVVDTTTDPGITNDLVACANESSAWYAVGTVFQSAAIIAAVAAWTEANGRLYLADTQDTEAANHAASGATDIAHALHASVYARSGLLFHPASDAFAAFAWYGDVLPADPGSETWDLKTLVGPAYTVLTATQITNLRAKFCNYYIQLAGVNLTQEGWVAANEWIDVVRFRDWLVIGLQEDVLAALIQVKKIAFTDRGVATLEAVIRARLALGVKQGGLSDNPKPTVTSDLVKNATSADKTARIWRGTTFDGTLAGAIHHLVLNGVLVQ